MRSWRVPRDCCVDFCLSDGSETGSGKKKSKQEACDGKKDKSWVFLLLNSRRRRSRRSSSRRAKNACEQNTVGNRESKWCRYVWDRASRNQAKSVFFVFRRPRPRAAAVGMRME